MNPRLLYLDGAKSGLLDVWGDAGWQSLGFALSSGGSDKFTLAQKIGILYRAVKIRSQSISQVPWEIIKGDRVVWSDGDDDVPAELEWFQNWPELLSLTEASLTMTSQAYWFLLRNRVRITGVQWYSPLTMTPVWDKQLGLTGFTRSIDAKPQPVKLEDVVYIWYRSAMHETKPETSPLEAAQVDSQIISNLNLFISTFFERGAIKATILTLEGPAVQSEKDKLKAWWESALTGIKKAFSTEVISASVKPIVVGEGVKELSNNQLSKEKREDIVATLGVPLSKIFSNAANFATAQLDDKAFFQNTILPDCKIIQTIANKALRSTGYRIKFTPETMDIFQDDETERADSFSKYVTAGMKQSIAAAILGIELPEGIEYADLDPEEKPVVVVVPPVVPPVEEDDMGEDDVEEPDEVKTAKQLEDFVKFKRKVLKRLQAGKSAVTEFQSDVIPLSVLTAVSERLHTVNHKEGVERLFDPAYLKGLLLRLDDDDDDAEREARMAIERNATRSITNAFAKFQDEMFSEGEPKNASAEKQRIINEFVNNQGIKDAMSRMLQDAVDAGIQTSVKQFDTIGLGFDWAVPNAQARFWAQNYTDTLLNQLGTTTGNGVGDSIARWIDNGEPLSSLIKDLEPLFGKDRASLIASTEVTRAYTQGNLAGWREAGYGEGEPSEVSPKHPRCRCILVLRINDDGSADYVWYTAVDERVCPQCGPLHNKVLGQARKPYAERELNAS